MEIEYKGANCLVISEGKSKLVIDPKLSSVGQKDYIVKDAVQLATGKDFVVEADQKLIVDGPGEYEVAGISIKGIAATEHSAEDGQIAGSTIYTIHAGTTRLCVLGHIKGELKESQLEEIGVVDILTIPVGGGGYTLDAHEAVAVSRQIDPKVIVPTHYADKALKYAVLQAELADFLKEFGSSEHEKLAKLKLKSGSALPEVSSITEVTRTS